MGVEIGGEENNYWSFEWKGKKRSKTRKNIEEMKLKTKKRHNQNVAIFTRAYVRRTGYAICDTPLVLWGFGVVRISVTTEAMAVLFWR